MISSNPNSNLKGVSVAVSLIMGHAICCII